ncbi:DUF3885 domain-containing protein [Sphingomonas sp. LT1P40]|uniref:DUF3885 domain-containing protein n=1 Tax=Alteristakelama amylovorans TaxID=3096166 RepID=UPI002FC6D3C2
MALASPLTRQFLDDWSRFHAGRLPLGWLLRQDVHLPWVRFHALPESKRYAENDEERSIILHRANALAERLLGLDSGCWVIEARSAASKGGGELAMEAAESDDPDGFIWSFYVRLETWQTGRYDRELMAIADDDPNPVIWMRQGDGAIFAPYDGGFDLFPTTRKAVRLLKSQQPDWLSKHPKGL